VRQGTCCINRTSIVILVFVTVITVTIVRSHVFIRWIIWTATSMRCWRWRSRWRQYGRNLDDGRRSRSVVKMSKGLENLIVKIHWIRIFLVRRTTMQRPHPSRQVGRLTNQAQAQAGCLIKLRPGRLADWLIRFRLRQADWSGSGQAGWQADWSGWGSDRLIDQPWGKSTGENLVRTSEKLKRCVEECIEGTKRVVLLPSTIQAIQDLPPLSKV